MRPCATLRVVLAKKQIFTGVIRKGCALSRHCLDHEGVRYPLVARNHSNQNTRP